MKNLVAYNHPGRDSSSNSQSGSGGGPVEDILKRLGNVETDVSELKAKVSAILATVPHLATKADVMDVRSAVAEVRAEMKEETGSLRAELKAESGAIRTEMAEGFGALRAEIAGRETAFIRWIIATVVAVSGVAFSLAKFVH